MPGASLNPTEDGKRLFVVSNAEKIIIILHLQKGK